MRITRREAEDAAQLANVKAFYEVIADGESNHTDDAYTLINGGGHFESFKDHPYKGLTSPPGRAAGKPQFIASTWAEVSSQLGLEDFSPRNQYLGYIGRLAYRGALADVLAGNIEEAIYKCRDEWTSLPGASENTRYTMAKAKAVYQQYGGTFGPSGTVSDTQAPAPIEDRSTPYIPTQQEKPVAPLILPILNVLASFLPALGKIFSDGSVKGQRIEAVAPMLADAITKVTGAVNLQDAAEKIQADSAVAVTANKAVEQVVYELTEVGGGVADARKYTLEVANTNVPLMKLPSFVVTLLLLCPVAFTIFMVLGGKGFALLVMALFMKMPDKDMMQMIGDAFAFSADMQNVVITAVVSGVLMAVVGFWLGLSYARQKTDANPLK